MASVFKQGDPVIFDIEGSERHNGGKPITGRGVVSAVFPGGGIRVQPEYPINGAFKMVNIRKPGADKK